MLEELSLRIIFKIAKIEDLKKMKEAELYKVRLSSSKDERTCNWCLNMDKEIIDISKVDLIKLIDDNCKCKYNRSSIIAIFE